MMAVSGIATYSTGIELQGRKKQSTVGNRSSNIPKYIRWVKLADCSMFMFNPVISVSD